MPLQLISNPELLSSIHAYARVGELPDPFDIFLPKVRQVELTRVTRRPFDGPLEERVQQEADKIAANWAEKDRAVGRTPYIKESMCLYIDEGELNGDMLRVPAFKLPYNRVIANRALRKTATLQERAALETELCTGAFGSILLSYQSPSGIYHLWRLFGIRSGNVVPIGGAIQSAAVGSSEWADSSGRRSPFANRLADEYREETGLLLDEAASVRKVGFTGNRSLWGDSQLHYQVVSFEEPADARVTTFINLAHEVGKGNTIAGLTALNLPPQVGISDAIASLPILDLGVHAREHTRVIGFRQDMLQQAYFQMGLRELMAAYTRATVAWELSK